MLLVPSGVARGLQSPQEAERGREPWVSPTAPGGCIAGAGSSRGITPFPPPGIGGCQFPSRAACRTRVPLLTYNESSYRGTRLLCRPLGELLTMKPEVLEKKATKSKHIFQI